jgi:ComF family protein
VADKDKRGVRFTIRQLQGIDSVNNWTRIIQDWLFPPTCLLCGDAGTAGRDLCPACAKSLPLNHPACPRCATPLPFETGLPCGACQHEPPAFAESFALFRYQNDGETGYLIKSLKFHARHSCARLLGDLLADALAGRESRPELIIPVPLHRSRYRERGYNQSLEIARIVAQRLRIRLDFNTCIRSKNTQSQTELNAEERRRNVSRAFALTRPLQARHVAIFDDIVTTGSTVNELAKALRKAGAEKVEVWACARAGQG